MNKFKNLSVSVQRETLLEIQRFLEGINYQKGELNDVTRSFACRVFYKDLKDLLKKLERLTWVEDSVKEK